MDNEYEVVKHAAIHVFKIFLVNLLYREPHIHSDYEICYILEGKVVIKSRGKTLCLEKGDFVFLNSCQPHEVYSGSDNYALILTLQVVPGFCKDYFPAMSEIEFEFCSGSEYLPKSIRKIFFSTIVELAFHYYRRDAGFEFHCMCLLNLLFYQLIKYLPFTKIPPGEKNKIAEKKKRIQEITYYIDTHYQEKLILSDIAGRNGLSASYLSHFFKDNFKISFQEYLSNIRCEKARQLLLLTEHNLLDISLESGFSDPKYLNGAFLAKYGCTPKQYRKQFSESDLPFQQKTILSTQKFFSDQTSLNMLQKYSDSARRIFRSGKTDDIL